MDIRGTVQDLKKAPAHTIAPSTSRATSSRDCNEAPNYASTMLPSLLAPQVSPFYGLTLPVGCSAYSFWRIANLRPDGRSRVRRPRRPGQKTGGRISKEANTLTTNPYNEHNLLKYETVNSEEPPENTSQRQQRQPRNPAIPSLPKILFKSSLRRFLLKSLHKSIC